MTDAEKQKLYSQAHAMLARVTRLLLAARKRHERAAVQSTDAQKS